jgi:VIT1/CCC1 family predicted Fe2+/Mn2+ transporter
MNKNVGGMDQKARLVVGTILIVLGIGGYTGLVPVAVGPLPQALTSIVLVVIAGILLVTGGTQTCPINTALGRNTCQDE